MLDRLNALPRWALILIAALIARGLTFGSPLLHVDEEFYFVTAQRIVEGAVPYVDVWDRKPIGLFLIYMPAAALGVPLGIWAYQAMALACVVGTAWLIARMAEKAGFGRGALVGAILYILCLNFGDGQGGQAPVFYNLLVAGAFALSIPDPADRAGDWARMGKGVLALLLVGLAMQIKYTAVFEGVFLGLWLMWREWRLGSAPVKVVVYGSVMVAAAVLPTAAAWAAFARAGHGDAFVFANFTSILARRSEPWFRLLGAALKAALILAPLLILAGFSRHTRVEGNQKPVRDLMFGWLIAAVVGFVIFGSWFNHYTLPVMVPAAVCAAGVLGSHPRGRNYAGRIVIACFVIGQAVILSNFWIRGDRAQLETMAGAIGHGPGCLYVYSGTSMIYAYTGRCAVTAWIFPSHIARERENGALGVDQLEEVDRIFAKRPQFVVMRPKFIGERLEARERVMRQLDAGGYRLKGRWPIGDQILNVYEASATVSPRRAASSPE
ncbi:MAG: hypothetical protein ACAH11_10010 [Sphingomonas sp.]